MNSNFVNVMSAFSSLPCELLPIIEYHSRDFVCKMYLQKLPQGIILQIISLMSGHNLMVLSRVPNT